MNTGTRRTRLVVVRRPKQRAAEAREEQRSELEGINFSEMFPDILNAGCGEIELVRQAPINRTVSRKPVNGRPEVIEECRIPTFCRWDDRLITGMISITIFCAFLTFLGIAL